MADADPAEMDADVRERRRRAEANPPEETLDPAVRVGYGLICQLYCVRDGTTDEQLIATANQTEPTGTHAGTWVLYPGNEGNGQCPDYPNRQHKVVTC